MNKAVHGIYDRSRDNEEANGGDPVICAMLTEAGLCRFHKNTK